MPWPERDLAWGLTRAWLDECESLTRAAASALAGALAAVPLPGSRPALHWERTGQGPAVLLIMGLGLSGGAWWRTIPVLSERFEVITFDNRGVGRPHALRHAYSTAVMADDAVSVLDAAGIDRAHVYGVSLGGMVAQQVALRHPDRVRSLVLGATYAGGPKARRPDDSVLTFLRGRLLMPHAEAARRSVQFNYSDRGRAEHQERIEEDLAQRLAHPFSVRAYWAQLWAGATHDTYQRLPGIAAPTLIVHGSEDRMIPVENGRMLARAIPHARLVELPRTGHLYATEVPEIDREIAAFFSEHSAAPISRKN